MDFLGDLERRITVSTNAHSENAFFLHAWFPALRFRSSLSVYIAVSVIVSAPPFRSAVAVALAEREQKKIELDPI